MLSSDGTDDIGDDSDDDFNEEDIEHPPWSPLSTASDNDELCETEIEESETPLDDLLVNNTPLPHTNNTSALISL